MQLAGGVLVADRPLKSARARTGGRGVFRTSREFAMLSQGVISHSASSTLGKRGMGGWHPKAEDFMAGT